MALNPGLKLGPYEIVAPLGAGGMGEVYRARDTRLGRDVAIKVLPAHLADTADAKARFEREARAISGLNHPHICTLHDIGHEGGLDYLVMELVEGETLAARLTHGALPAPDLLRIGVQIAEALDAAHRHGIVHRDLKPGNVMLTKSGAKLMDFGLARASGAGTASGALSADVTRTTPLTVQGSLVGTFLYMSPEQLEGKEADARSDIWALGCVLYEMAAGRRAFEGATQASLISAIMRDRPRPLGELSPLNPPALDRLVQQCLAKDPDDRWQSAGDVKRELQWIADSTSGAGATAPAAGARPRRRRPAWLPWAVCGLLLAALVVTVLAGGRRGAQAPERLVRFVVPQPAGATLSVPAEMALAPDGSTLVFVLGDSTGAPRLALRPLRTAEVRVLPGTEGASLPFWSPDGHRVGFFANGRLLKVALDGSAPVVLCDAPSGRGGVWAPGGTILFAPNNSGPIFRVGESGGDPVAVTRIDPARHEFGHRYPNLLPDGRHFLYISIRPSDRHTVCVGSLDGGKPRELFASYSVARYASGFLLTNERGRMMARRFDPGSLAVHGDPQLVAEGAEQDNIGYDNLAPDGGSTLVFQRRAAQTARLEWLGRDGARLPTVVPNAPADGAVALSPDGRRLVYSTRDPRDLWTLDLDAAVPARLTFEDGNINGLTISPDGRRVAFGRQLGFGAYELRVKPLDGAGPEVPLFHGPGLFTLPAAWSPDGRWIVTAVSDSTGAFDFWLVPSGGQEPAHRFEHTPGDETAAAFSPDGRWMAYAATERGKVAIYVVSFPVPGAKYQLSLPETVGPQVAWSRDGRELFLGDTRDRVIAVEIQTAPAFRQGAAKELFAVPPNGLGLGVAPGGDRFLFGVLDPATSRAALEVVLGWPLLLETRR